MGTNYKDTLNLPQTDFPMKAGLVEREPERLAKWEAQGLYGKIQAARADAPLFVLHDGPPFANGDVHMGTAMNKILKDIIVKSRTMMGLRAPFVPGWDCHGLPIEFKVVKESRGLSPLEVRKKSEAYARKFIDVQRAQFKRLGVFGDWENPYLTLDPAYEAEIIRAFATFVEKGLVYQSKKPVYWSTGAQTALAEAEVEYADREDPAIFVKFPVSAEEVARIGLPADKPVSLVIWTTTPWTLPANVAIAVHPDIEYEFVGTETERFLIAHKLYDAFQAVVAPRFIDNMHFRKGRDLVGLRARHPFLDRDSIVIAADFVTTETGTGQVHIAPGHGADDYLAGVENGLPILSPVDEHGRFTEEVGIPVWAGKYVFDANRDVIEHLRENGTLLAEQIYKHSYPHCWRSKTPIVFRAVEQFFIRMDGGALENAGHPERSEAERNAVEGSRGASEQRQFPEIPRAPSTPLRSARDDRSFSLRSEALAAIDEVAWLPHWGRNRIHGTVESRPDWCISRQRSWGVPLPVFYDPNGKPILDPKLVRKVADLVEKHGTNIWFELDDAAIAEKLGLPEGTTRRNDTLDVWIDSGVSHEAVLRKRSELRAPADVYIEGTDQHRGWFQSSLLTSVALHGDAPYKTVITNGFIVDMDGRKISKSSSYKKPMNADHFVGKYGADIVRLWVSSVDYTDEVAFSEEIFTRIVDTYRRIRNTLRILLANLYDFESGKQEGRKAELTTVDRWVLHRLQTVIATCREAYESYEFHKVYHALNEFCAVDLSSLYVDITKDRMYCDEPDSPRRGATQFVMHEVLQALAQLLAPILAYTADEAWEGLGVESSVHLETFPTSNEKWKDEKLGAEFEALLNLRGVVAQAVEQARKEKLIGNALEGAVVLAIPDDRLRESLTACKAELEEIFILSDLEIVSGGVTRASVKPVSHKKCDRCWRHRASVGLSQLHPDLCDRCERVVSKLTVAK